MTAPATTHEALLLALPESGSPVVVHDLPRLTGLDERAVAVGVAALWGQGLVHTERRHGVSFVRRSKGGSS